MNYFYVTLLGLISLPSLYAQNIGIGTTNPTEKLHVVGNTRVTALGGTGNTLVLSDNNGVLSTRAFSGNTTDILDGTGNFVSISSFVDDDWQVLGNNLLSIPTGNVGIGTANPAERLVVYRDQDISSEIGMVHLGYMGHSDKAGFSHIDVNDTLSYALLQNSFGETVLNAASGRTIELRQNNTKQIEMETDGDLFMAGDNSFKQPNNVCYIKSTNTQSYPTNDDWQLTTDTTTEINVEPGNIIKMEANFLTRLVGGSSVDDYDYKVVSTGTCGVGDHNIIDGYRPDESTSNHDNFKPAAYLDYHVVSTCTGTMSFRLEIRNTGDDSYEVKDAVLFITKY